MVQEILSNEGVGIRFADLTQLAVSQMVPDLSEGKDPDDAFSKIPYEAGFLFLSYLQSVSCTPELSTVHFSCREADCKSCSTAYEEEVVLLAVQKLLQCRHMTLLLHLALNFIK